MLCCVVLRCVAARVLCTPLCILTVQSLYDVLSA